jgi:DNA helicase-2/ATP-dependent DNA helicase PcrA
MSQLLEGLNPEQLKAVTAPDGPLLILAGAGSGKTRVLTHRIAYLLNERNISPYNILAITFTNKAAAEMRERLTKLCGSDADLMWIKTFHGACLTILRRNAEYLGYRPGFNIYDDSDQKTVVKDCMRLLNIDTDKIPVKNCLSVISDAKNKMITPESFFEHYGNDYIRILFRLFSYY